LRNCKATVKIGLLKKGGLAVNKELEVSNLVELFLNKTKQSIHLAAFHKQFFHRISLSHPKRLIYHLKEVNQDRFKYSVSMADEMAHTVHQLFNSQDLCLEAYRRIFFIYHRKPHIYSVWRPFSANRVFNKVSYSHFNKALSTIHLRERRIKKY
jgi:hypothetical protein